MFQDKPKANWTPVHEVVSNNGVKRSFYFSDKGALKITRHTDKGEQIVSIMPGAALSDLAEVFPCELIERLQEAHSAAKQTFEQGKADAKAKAQAMREVQKAALNIQVQREKLTSLGLAPEAINAILGVKAS